MAPPAAQLGVASGGRRLSFGLGDGAEGGALGAPPYSASLITRAPAAECNKEALTKEVERKEAVRQECREQVPKLMKIKQALQAQQVSFARMTNDALNLYYSGLNLVQNVSNPRFRNEKTLWANLANETHPLTPQCDATWSYRFAGYRFQ